MNTKLHIILAPAALLGVVGSAASACGKTEAAAAPHAAEADVLHVLAEETEAVQTWSDGKTEVRLVNKDGKVRVIVNGQEVMSMDEGDAWSNLGKDSAELHARRNRELAREIRDRVRQGLAPMAVIPPGERPKVMIGVTMERADEADINLPEGQNPENATVITRVVKDLPAETAGLKEGDIVVRVNGTDSASPDDIRQAIKQKNEGDDLRLGIIREGKEQEIAITLAPYDPEKLGSPRAWSGSWTGQAPAAPLAEKDVKRLAELRAQMEKTSAEMEKVGAQLAAATSDAQREELGVRLAELGAELADLGTRMGEASGGRGFWRGFGPDSDLLRIERLPRMRIERGTPGSPPRAYVFGDGTGQAPTTPPADDQIEALNKRLDRLEALLEKMVDEKRKP